MDILSARKAVGVSHTDLVTAISGYHSNHRHHTHVFLSLRRPFDVAKLMQLVLKDQVKTQKVDYHRANREK